MTFGPLRRIHAFTVKHEGLANRIITPLGISKVFDPKNPPEEIPPYSNTSALWDTGATNSCVTKAVADRVGLIPTGSGFVDHAGGRTERNRYTVNFLLPNRVGVAGVQVTECDSPPGGFGAIVGMDVIMQGDFTITNLNHKTWMTFRIPSIQQVDYVIESNRINYAGVKRNDPCPCGKKDINGNPVKFKKCCGRSII
jgi:hypothetical protein